MKIIEVAKTALGRDYRPDDVRGLMASIGLGDIRDAEFLRFAAYPLFGVCLVFSEGEFVSGAAPGTMPLAAIQLYGCGRDSYAAFRSELPLGVHFGQTIEDVLKLHPTAQTGGGKFNKMLNSIMNRWLRLLRDGLTITMEFGADGLDFVAIERDGA